MLFHFAPKIHVETVCDIRLLSITLMEIGLKLEGDNDVVARRPYPNKCYFVACRKSGQKAMIGLIVEIPEQLREVTVQTEWMIDGNRVVTHTVLYKLIGQHGEIGSDEVLLWMGDSSENLESICPKRYLNNYPLEIRPCMEIYPTISRASTPKDIMESGVIIVREEEFEVPLMPLSRFSNDLCPIRRLPSPETAIALER